MSGAETQIGEDQRFDFSKFPEDIVVDGELKLSPFSPEDAQGLADITDDDEAVQKYIPWAKEDKTAYIERVNRDRQYRGPRYAIRLGGQLAGHIAVFPSHDTLGVIEIGYVLAQNARGRQVLDRALPKCEALVLESYPRAKLALCINDENVPSQKVAERLGYKASDIISSGDRMYFKVASHG
ncbi:MAG TPA: GNAT family N-acetyltransferase [Candidatus Saccharibacteria bacterium]|nr:GNAT family N-acetyltransferase [Candidatus Saccharibacteria bacterium]